jgi:hypothetical protein
MKTTSRLTMVLGIMTIAMVTAGVPLGKHETNTTPEQLAKCYTDQEISLLMEAGHYQRGQAIELLELACNHAISISSENE